MPGDVDLSAIGPLGIKRDRYCFECCVSLLQLDAQPLRKQWVFHLDSGGTLGQGVLPGDSNALDAYVEAEALEDIDQVLSRRPLCKTCNARD